MVEIGTAFVEIEFDHLCQRAVLAGGVAGVLDLSHAFFGAAQIPAKGLAEASAVDRAIAVERTRPLAGTLQPIAPALLIGTGRRVTTEELEMDRSSRLVFFLGNGDKEHGIPNNNGCAADCHQICHV